MFLLKNVTIDRHKLEQASQDHEDMEHRVHPPYLAADAIENCADGIADAAG